ncbi:YwdI family protein [Bacillus sp. V3B]|uniref:YwdI family protein n=1 Tax=Bacillus sp. V3B TaxID=2804915 RepID=UPI00210C9417|nr:YwdI family protein [Bacillus sp. V3B]MCQ6274562.1 YwdI family protein [Bacillus sp. V3B]
MNISVNKLFDKMEEELREAKKMSSDAKIRERTYAIKAICELILEESSFTTNKEISKVVSPTPPPAFVQPIKVVETPQQNRIKTEDGANGESLFDF